MQRRPGHRSLASLHPPQNMIRKPSRHHPPNRISGRPSAPRQIHSLVPQAPSRACSLLCTKARHQSMSPTTLRSPKSLPLRPCTPIPISAKRSYPLIVHRTASVRIRRPVPSSPQHTPRACTHPADLFRIFMHPLSSKTASINDQVPRLHSPAA